MFTDESNATDIDTARAFLRSASDTPASKLVCLALDVTDVWFERPHDATIWAAIIALARDGTDPHLPLVRGYLIEHGQVTREIEARIIAIASEPFCGTQGQLAQYRRAIATEAFVRIHREGLEGCLAHSATDSIPDAMTRLTELGTRLRKLHNVISDAPSTGRQLLKAVTA